MKIRFEYEGVRYVVDEMAYELDRIVLPNGKALKVLSWLEKNPPIPRAVREICHSYGDTTPEELAESLKAVVAREA